MLYSVNENVLEKKSCRGALRLKVTTWTKQYNATTTGDVPAMNELSDWLMRNLPAEDNEVTLVHGDFRLDNLIFHPTEVILLIK